MIRFCTTRSARKKRVQGDLGATTDDPVALANRAIKEAEAALRDKDPVGVREGANKAWLAICSLADVAADKMGRPILGGTSGRREALHQLEKAAKLRGSMLLAFESARTVLHGECFHGDTCPEPEQLVDMMRDVRDTVQEGMNAIPKATRAIRRKRQSK